MYCTLLKTCLEKKEEVQLTFEDFLNGLGSLDPEQYTTKYEKRIVTFETKYEDSMEKLYNSSFAKQAKTLPALPDELCDCSDLTKHYSSFKIPKKSGGLRQIDAPDEILKEYLSRWKFFIEWSLLVLPHNAAHAYVPGRSTYTALKVHQENKSKWFLKLDIHDFFGSHNKEYVMNTLNDIFPFTILFKDQEYKNNFEKAIYYAFLNDKLPQGTPLSPTLTNVLMAGIDYDIQNYCNAKGLVYTRYADDILISSKYDFEWKNVQKKIVEILKNHKTPFEINKKKTRYGSSAGRNWNLGLMLNKDNKITIGHKENQRLRAMINNFCNDHIRGINWTYEDRQHLAGLIAYTKSIEPDYMNHVISTYRQKFNFDILKVLRAT